MGCIYEDNEQSLNIVCETFKVVMKPFICQETLGYPSTELHGTCKKKGLKVEKGWTVKVFINGHFMGKGEC
jgi:hypothetical protein